MIKMMVEVCYNKDRNDDPWMDHRKLYCDMGFVLSENKFTIQNGRGADVFMLKRVVWIQIDGKVYFKRRESKKYG